MIFFLYSRAPMYQITQHREHTQNQKKKLKKNYELKIIIKNKNANYNDQK